MSRYTRNFEYLICMRSAVRNFGHMATIGESP
jgi:hypothetical protein